MSELINRNEVNKVHFNEPAHCHFIVKLEKFTEKCYYDEF